MNKILMVLLFFVLNLSAQIDTEWQAFTYMNNVIDIINVEDELWVATTGGAYKFNTNSNKTEVYTNVDGLSSLKLSAISIDKHENLIFGSSDGLLSFYSLKNYNWSYENSLADQNIVDIEVIEDTLWVASDNGIGVFIYNGLFYEFRDFYDDLPILPEQAFKIAYYNNKIYYGTINGLLYAPADFVKFNLKSKDNWNVYDTNNILPNNSVKTLNVINDTLYIGTSNGVRRIANNSWYDNAFNWNAGVVNNILFSNDSLYFFRNTDYYVFDGLNWQSRAGFVNQINCVSSDMNGNIWVGLKDNGIQNLDWNSSFLMDGPASNIVGRIVKDNLGSLWMTSGKFKVYYTFGFYKYDFNSWTNFKFYGNNWNWKNSTDVVFKNRDGDIWIGAWGGGVTTISDDDMTVFHSWPDSGRLVISNSTSEEEIKYDGIAEEFKNCFPPTPLGGGDYCVVTDFAEDAAGNLWAAVHGSANFKYILAIPRNSDNTLDIDCNNWKYFGNNVGMGPDDGEVSLMDFDDFGRLWVGTFQSGIVILDYNETLDNASDDRIFKVGLEDNLYSNTVLCIKKDDDGVMWIGTAAGLNSYDGQNFYKHIGNIGPIENKINYIFVDDFNNKWFATDGGISILEGDKSPWDETAWTHYTTENSGLVNKIVNSIFVDSDKGEAYIGTEGGLSIFKGAFSEIRQNFDNLSGGPNPFFIDNNANTFTIKNLMVNSTVKILNINGKLIKLLSEENGLVKGSRAYWNGRDSKNNLVASGIYIYLIYTEDGVTGKGKISVIRK